MKDNAVEIGVGVVAAGACGVAAAGTVASGGAAAPVAIVACGAAAAAIGGVAGNIYHDRDLHDGVVQDAVVGGAFGLGGYIVGRVGQAVVPWLRRSPTSSVAKSPATAPRSALDDLARVCRSFSEDTEVLMADGTTTPISNVQVGDEVWAADPETGEAGNRTVTAVWPHQDWLVDFTVEGGSVTTTEDHHFWNVTDGAWQETQHIDAGDDLFTSEGERLEAGSLDWSTLDFADAFDLTVDGLHTYFVVTAGGDVLVHNAGCGPLRGRAATDAASNLGYSRRLPPQKVPFNSHGQSAFFDGRRYITPDVDAHSGGVWKMFDRQGNRLGTYDADLNRIGN